MNRRLCGEKKACPLHTADLERLGGRAEAVPARVGGPVLRRPGVAGEVLEQLSFQLGTKIGAHARELGKDVQLSVTLRLLCGGACADIDDVHGIAESTTGMCTRAWIAVCDTSPAARTM